jgi:hypothetical protein
MLFKKLVFIGFLFSFSEVALCHTGMITLVSKDGSYQEEIEEECFDFYREQFNNFVENSGEMFERYRAYEYSDGDIEIETTLSRNMLKAIIYFMNNYDPEASSFKVFVGLEVDPLAKFNDVNFIEESEADICRCIYFLSDYVSRLKIYKVFRVSLSSVIFAFLTCNGDFSHDFHDKTCEIDDDISRAYYSDNC